MMIRPKKYQAKVIKHEQLTNAVYRTQFEPILAGQDRFEYYPGQFVTITVNDKQRRSYSLSSSPTSSKYLETIIDISPNGPGSQFFSRLSAGDMFEFIGPLGNFGRENEEKFELESDDGYDIFLATGTGITPFLSILKTKLYNNKTSRKSVLYWGLRHETDIYLTEQLNQLQDNNNFEYFICLSQPHNEHDWQSIGLTGYVQDNYHANRENYIDINKEFKNNRYYICGGKEFIEQTTKKLVENNVDHGQISSEKFF